MDIRKKKRSQRRGKGREKKKKRERKGRRMDLGLQRWNHLFSSLPFHVAIMNICNEKCSKHLV